MSKAGRRNQKPEVLEGKGLFLYLIWRDMVSVHYIPARYPSAHPLPPLSIASHSRGVYCVFGTLTTILGAEKGKRAYCYNGEGRSRQESSAGASHASICFFEERLCLSWGTKREGTKGQEKGTSGQRPELEFGTKHYQSHSHIEPMAVSIPVHFSALPGRKEQRGQGQIIWCRPHD